MPLHFIRWYVASPKRVEAKIWMLLSSRTYQGPADKERERGSLRRGAGIAAKLTVNLAAMFPRDLQPPRSSFFLFGPRGTGKSTWIRSHFEDAYVVNLLPADSMLRYERDPSHFSAEVLARPTSQWIVIDEVQRVPKLLDDADERHRRE